jgi:hypothetical protein
MLVFRPMGGVPGGFGSGEAASPSALACSVRGRQTPPVSHRLGPTGAGVTRGAQQLYTPFYTAKGARNGLDGELACGGRAKGHR